MEATNLRLETIQKWKYDSKDQSILYPYLLKYGVEPAAKFIPPDMSPNTITVIGFAFTVFAVIFCLLKQNLSAFDVHIICWASGLAYFFDALDGQQGRKWRKEKKDVYVLTQLFDHGFDSLTALLNTYIIARVLELDPFCQRLLFICLTGVFITSTMEYKVKRVLIFGPFNNPTESVAMNIVLLTCASIFPLSNTFKMYTVTFVTVGSILANAYALFQVFKIGNSSERLEILAVAYFFITIGTSLWGDHSSTSFVLQRFEFASLFHIMELRIICCEIIKENCPLELFLVVTPVLLLNNLSVGNWFAHMALTGIYTSYCAWLWIGSSGLICKALKMKNAFSKPPANNNPFLNEK